MRVVLYFCGKFIEMDFRLRNEAFVVGGAGSGFGRAITEFLAQEGAKVLAVSRTGSKLDALADLFPDNIECLAADITQDTTHGIIANWVVDNKASGIVFNAGGPPAGGFQETSIEQWDVAYHSVLRWKIQLVKAIVPYFVSQGYGRLLFIESVSVKQPVKNLVLSNAFRVAVAGAVKTMAGELAGKGITANLLAPGYHSTAAMERLFVKKSQMEGISLAEAEVAFTKEIPVGSMGEAKEMATIAGWLLSPLSRYVTGQTISHDGGLVAGIFG